MYSSVATRKNHWQNIKLLIFYPNITLQDIALKEIKESDIVNHKAVFIRYIDFEKKINDLIFDGFYETENGTLGGVRIQICSQKCPQQTSKTHFKNDTLKLE